MSRGAIKIGNSIGFIDGPTTCEHHNWNGDTIFYSASGKRITPLTYLKWASYTAPLRERLIYEHHEEIDDPITSAFGSCKNCKQEFSPIWDMPNF